PNRGRPTRSVDERINGVGRDVGQSMVTEGVVLWDPRGDEYTHNRDYAIRAEKAAARHIGIWRTDHCGSGPAQATPIRVTVNWDAPGDDGANPNGEYFAVHNDGSTTVGLARWWLRDSALRR